MPSQKKVSFEEAFPEIRDLQIKVTILSEGSKFVNYVSTFTMKNKPREYFDCRNPICYNGGFSIGQILRKMVDERQTHHEESAMCQGYEGSPKGRKRYRSCLSHWRIEVNIEYDEPYNENKISMK